jgi:hypothetical protein
LRFPAKTATILTLKLAVKRPVNYPYDIDSHVGTGCFISIVKTSLFRSISSISAGLLKAPPSCANLGIIIRLNNHDFSKGEPTEDRYAGDRSARAGEQLIIDTSLRIVEIHKNLPPGEKETFAQAYKKMCDSLAQNQSERLKRLEAIPQRLPDLIRQPKVIFIPGRKRALTGREAADLQEKEEARQRRRAQIQGEIQAQNDAQQEQEVAVYSQFQEEIAKEYSQLEKSGKSGKSLVLIDSVNILINYTDTEVDDPLQILY